eukprot:TRINITY_DN2117_c1_g1_i1.p4 TRINITY_DN2117_c1_g1~~TRINITY_DN2117_c1_g1_i1.p4  ORF type:complete len:137 (+),score=4.48 TRINITY_DN2117_c1_g1_i1:422-832(+)
MKVPHIYIQVNKFLFYLKIKQLFQYYIKQSQKLFSSLSICNGVNMQFDDDKVNFMRKKIHLIDVKFLLKIWDNKIEVWRLKSQKLFSSLSICNGVNMQFDDDKVNFMRKKIHLIDVKFLLKIWDNKIEVWRLKSQE